MILKNYLMENGIPISFLARKIGYHSNHVGQVARGQINPSVRMAMLIEYATNGNVKADELVNQIDKP